MVVSKFCPPGLSLYIGLSIFIFYRNFINTSCNFVGCLYGKFFVAQWIYLQLPSASTFIFLLRSPKAELTINKVSKLGLNSKLSLPLELVPEAPSTDGYRQRTKSSSGWQSTQESLTSSFRSMSPEIVGSLTKSHCVIAAGVVGLSFLTRCPSASRKGGNSHSLKIQCYTCRTWFFFIIIIF